MTVRVAVDFGTSSTCVVVSVNGRDPQVVVIDGQPLMSSAVYAAADGTLFVGQEAERQAAMDPSRYEPNPKRRIDEGELLLGDSVLRVTDVVHAVLLRAVSEARRLAGGAEVNLLVLTHPADWGAVRTRLLRQAAGGLAREVTLVPEPVAAAVFHAATFAPAEVNRDRTVEVSRRPGENLAVLDLGGGTVDVSVVSRPPANPGRRGGFQVLATRGDPSFGGADVDQALLEHVGGLVSSAAPDAWRELVEGRELADRRRRRVLRQDVRGAKETLSRHAYTDVPMPEPFADAHVTRDDLEKLIEAPLSRAVELTRAAIEEAGLRPKQLSAIFLVGGSSRIPMISRLIHERTGVVPTTLDQPETVVARGALLAVRTELERTAPPRPPVRRPVPDQRTEIVRPPARPAPVPHQQFAGRPSGGPPRPPAPPPVSAPHGMPAAEPSPRKRRKLPWLIGGAVVVIAAVVVGLVVLLNQDDSPPGKVVAQYHYQFSFPQDWTQTGGNPQTRETLIKPENAVKENDAISVQEFPLDFDASANPRQLADNLNAQAAKAGPAYTGFNPDATFAGRKVVYYRQNGDFGPIDWYVVAKGTVQVNVACQYATQAGHDRVASACDQVVRTVVVTG
ncbi:type VII secretion-associated protein [Amycolatopsis sp. K13G38]|uniref:Type VII secretion-associated protein n=1 Tax=Amycolatopsis acididurans TaxID=2724524 RepID=A0ABX1J971_9PSEU|nr:type VII secretion-associated protein [Amycolatopsis acididurans]NKQ56331.1 type VII secretion-associated protein [Amycolatopsis acididurans]